MKNCIGIQIVDFIILFNNFLNIIDNAKNPWIDSAFGEKISQLKFCRCREYEISS